MLLNLLLCSQAVHAVESAEESSSRQLHPAEVDKHLGLANLAPAQIDIPAMACGKVSFIWHFVTRCQCLCVSTFCEHLISDA